MARISSNKINRIAKSLGCKLTTKEPIRCDLDSITSPHHLLWMCKQIPRLPLSKATMWLGYIQGVMLLNNIIKESELDLTMDVI